MSNFAPHASYRECELSWISKIPSHWEFCRAKFLFNLEKRSPRERDGVITAFRDGQVTLRSNRRTDGFTNSFKEIGYQGVKKGDLVIHAMDAFAGAIGISDSDGKSTPVYSCLTPKKDIHTAYYAAFIRSMAISGYIESLAKGIRERSTDFRWGEISELVLPVPPLSEQQSIANYLDREVTRIDKLITKKTRFIELIKLRLLTKIVLSTSPRAEWSEFPFWVIAKSKSVTGRPNESLLSVYLDRGVIPYSEGGGLVHKPADTLEKYQLVEPGDLVMNNQQAWRGSLGVSPCKGIVSPAYLVFSLDKEKIDPDFANYAFRARPYVEKFMLASMSVGDIQRQLKWPHLRRTKVSLPCLQEQERISLELNMESERIHSLVFKTMRSIELLKEKRSALITAAVTGKIDVREAA